MKESTVKKEGIETRVVLSTLWIVIMFSMVFADILGLFLPGAIAEVMLGVVDGVSLTENLMFVSAMIIEIPILLILVSRVMSYKWNRRLNIIGAVITILFVVIGASFTLPYYLFASVEVLCLCAVIVTTFKWKERH